MDWIILKKWILLKNYNDILNPINKSFSNGYLSNGLLNSWLLRFNEQKQEKLSKTISSLNVASYFLIKKFKYDSKKLSIYESDALSNHIFSSFKCRK